MSHEHSSSGSSRPLLIIIAGMLACYLIGGALGWPQAATQAVVDAKAHEEAHDDDHDHDKNHDDHDKDHDDHDKDHDDAAHDSDDKHGEASPPPYFYGDPLRAIARGDCLIAADSGDRTLVGK